MKLVRTYLYDAELLLFVNCEAKIYIQKPPDVLIAVLLHDDLSFYHIYQ